MGAGAGKGWPIAWLTNTEGVHSQSVRPQAPGGARSFPPGAGALAKPAARVPARLAIKAFLLFLVS